MYNDLPGVKLTIKDGNLVLPDVSTDTQRVLILSPVDAGRANLSDGAINANPIRISDPETFGTKGVGQLVTTNPMATAWQQVYDAGCRDIHVVEVRGTSADEQYKNTHYILSVLEENFQADIILYSGMFADEVITQDVAISEERQDYGDAGEISTLLKSNTVLKDSFTEGAYTLPVNYIYSSVVIERQTGTEPSLEIVPLTEGIDYLIDRDARTITMIAEVGTDTILATYDTYKISFASQLGGYCEVVSAKNSQIIGVIALKSSTSPDLATMKSHINGQVTQVYSKFLQIVGGADLVFNLNNTPYESNFAAAYAGLISILKSYSSPLNKAIPGALMTTHSLSPSQIKALIAKNIVVPRTKNGFPVVADAITTAPAKSDYRRLTTVRIVNDAVGLTRAICEPYIGEPNTLPKRNSLSTALDSGYKDMVKRGALNNVRFSIRASLADQIDGNMRISLDLVPAFETKRIFIDVAARSEL